MKKITFLFLLIQFLVFPFFMAAQTRVVCVGNSITAGYGLTDASTQAWPSQLGKILGSSYSVLNCGESGTTMLKKTNTPYWNTNSLNNAKNVNPQIVIISLGTNDAHPNNWIYKNDFYNDYSAMIDEFRQNGRNPIIYVCYPATSYGDNDQMNNIQNEVIPLINQISIAKNVSIIDYNTPTKNQRNTLYNDNLHPNAAGALVLANTAFNAISASIPAFYKDCNYGGYAIKLGIGDYNLSALTALGISNDDVSSIKVPAGYKIFGYVSDNFTGNYVTLTTDNNCLGGWDNLITSVRVRANGVTGKNGTYSLKNRSSGKYMDVAGGNAADGAPIIQWNGNGENNQQFTFTDVGDGAYRINSAASGKAIDVYGASTNNASKVIQWSYGGGLNQHYILLAADNGYYKLKAAHSGRIIEVYGGGTNVGDALCQYDDNNQTHGQWLLATAGSTSKAVNKDKITALTPTEEASAVFIYPNPSSASVTITKVPSNSQIAVVDISGRVRLRLTSTENEGDFKIDVRNLESGVYMIKIGDDNASLKFIKN